MKTASRIFLFVLLAVRAPAAPASPAASGGALAEAWQTLANYRPDQAQPRFEKLAAGAGTDSRAARFGTALSLLAQPTAQTDRVEKARVLLTALAAEGADDLALGARFFLARLAEFQAEPPQPAAAAEGFRRLIADHPESPWAQAAVPRLAILLLYTPAGPAGPEARLDAAARLLPLALRPSAVTELHLVIADAVFHYRLAEQRALAHLLAAERAGAMDVPTRADVLVQIAELSRLGGDAPQAAAFYDKFLAEYPRDSRQYAVRKKLAGLAGPE
jgi:hypothetical protein